MFYIWKCIVLYFIKIQTFNSQLVELYPRAYISWYAVGIYYSLIKKWESARQCLSKSTNLSEWMPIFMFVFWLCQDLIHAYCWYVFSLAFHSRINCYKIFNSGSLLYCKSLYFSRSEVNCDKLAPCSRGTFSLMTITDNF